MPFVAGSVVLCQQGNDEPSGHTHSKDNNRHALDFSNTACSPLTVVAAAPGYVANLYTESDPRDRHAGLGYGNQVKVQHGDGYFTMYAHLDRVSVRRGDVVGVGTPLGTVGSTGAAGNRHLHFSLHEGVSEDLGVYETTPIQAIVATDLGFPPEFRLMNGEDFRSGRRSIWNGALYGSENRAGDLPRFGDADPELREALRSGESSLRAMIVDRIALDELSHEWGRRETAWSEEMLVPILSRTPRHAVGRYWQATAVHGPKGASVDAEAIYRDLLTTGPPEPTWETWLVSWCHNRLGVLALRRKAVDEARVEFEAGLETATAPPEQAFAMAELSRLDSRLEKDWNRRPR